MTQDLQLAKRPFDGAQFTGTYGERQKPEPAVCGRASLIPEKKFSDLVGKLRPFAI